MDSIHDYDLSTGDVVPVDPPPDPWLWWAEDPEMQLLMGTPRPRDYAAVKKARSRATSSRTTVDSISITSGPLCLQCRHCRRPFMAEFEGEPRSAGKLERHEAMCAQRHCEHCCRIFQSALECQGHKPLCPDNVKYQRCQFCTVRLKNAPEKRRHEAVCELNPDMCCEFCGKVFGHIALRNRHMQGCDRDPQRNCVYCRRHFASRSVVVAHEVCCKDNPSTQFAEGECAACGGQDQSLGFPCGEHRYCAPCLTKMLHVGLKDRSLLPLRCCKRFVEIGDAVDLSLSSMLPEKPRLKYQETMMLHGANQAMYCPNRKCGILIILDTLFSVADVKKMRHGWHTEVDVSEEASKSNFLSSSPIGCPKCQQAVCFKCRSEWHEGMTCPQYQFFASRIVDEVTKLCRKMNWMRCFQCGHVVEKKAGCNHITCFCGCQFCYLCGTKWGECKCQVLDAGHALRHNRAGTALAEAHRCQHCNQVSDSAEELRVHLTLCQAAQASLGGRFQCATCDARFPDYGQYRAHRRECVAAHTEQRQFAAEDQFERRRNRAALMNNSSAPH